MYKSKVLIIAFLLVGTANFVFAQTFNNTGGNYVAGSNAFIRMKGTAAGPGTAAANGEIVGIGTSAATRIPGTVIWARTATQDVKLTAMSTVAYFTNLGVANTGVKTFKGATSGSSITSSVEACEDGTNVPPEIEGTDNTFVSGTFLQYGTAAVGTVGGKVLGAATEPVIAHGCGHVFTYDGTAAQVVLNTKISGASENNRYSILRVNQSGAGTASIATGDTVTTAVVKVVTNLNLVGRLVLDAPTSCASSDAWNTVPHSSISDTVKLECGAELKDNVDITICGDGIIYIPDPDCPVPPVVDVACEATITYKNTNVSTEFKYGNIEFDMGVNATIQIDKDILVCNNVIVDNTFKITDPSNNPGTDNGIKIVGGDPGNPGTGGDVTFVDCAEIVGWVKRTVGNPGTAYHFNNQLTTAKISAFPATGPAEDKFFGVFNVPGGITTSGLNLAKVTNGYEFINRITKVATNGANLSEMHVGYLSTEVRTKHAGLGDTALTDEKATNFPTTVRGLEAFDITKDPLAFHGADGTKWGVGTANSCFNVMDITAILKVNGATGSPAPGTEVIGNKNQILFSNQPLTIVSKRSGRWSDPGTWYGGAIPQSSDSVVIGNTIYTGLYTKNQSNDVLFGDYNGSDDLEGDNVRNWGVNEHDLIGLQKINTNDVVLAKTVTIVTPDEAKSLGEEKGHYSNGNYYPALIIGNSEVGPTAADMHAGVDCNPTASDMNFSYELWFGEIINRSNAGTESWNQTSGDAVTLNDLKGADRGAKFGGLFVMKGRTAAQGTFAAETTASKMPMGPILGAINVTNSGKLFLGSLFDIGQ